jgi:hypothetical protein
MVDIFQEVDEALKQEKAEKFWNEYKNTIITAIIVLIGSTAITSAYKSWDAKSDQTQTAALISALEASDPKTGLEEFSQSTRRGHEVVAQMTRASLLLESDKPAAAEIYTSIAKQKSAPDDFRDLARILAVRHGTTENALTLLKPLLKDENNIFHWHARLEAATYNAHTNQDYAAAIENLKPFTENVLVPESLKQTAEALLHVYSQKNKS